MNRRVEGKGVLDILKGKNNLRDSTLTSLDLSDVNGELVVSLVFNLKASAEFKIIRLWFYEILEFGFYYSDQFSFYNVEAVKFLLTEDGYFYLSLDPDEKELAISKFDQDFVKAKFVKFIGE